MSPIRDGLQNLGVRVKRFLPLARIAAHRYGHSQLFEIARVFVPLDHVASFIINANHSIMRPAVKHRVTDCIADCARLVIPQTTEWQHIAD